MASLVETLDGRERFSTIPQLLVWIVFKDDNIILAAYFSQLFPTFKRESLASWVLEGGNDIYKFGMHLLYFLFYIFEYHATVVTLNTDAPSLEHLEDLHTVDKGGRFHQNNVTGVDIDLTEQVHGFKTTVNDDDLVKLCLQPLRFEQNVCDVFSEVGYAENGAIL